MTKISEGMVFAVIAVKNIDEARAFYSDTLGLKLMDEGAGGITYESGGGNLFVYESQFAGTNQATGAAWRVDDIKATVEDLKAAGVEFEHYDLPYGEWDGDVMVMEDEKAAWFKDPSGNILSVGENK